MDPNKGHGENIRTNNWTEKEVLRLTEPVVDALPLPVIFIVGSRCVRVGSSWLRGGSLHPLDRGRWTCRRAAKGIKKYSVTYRFPGEGGTSHSLRIAESRSSIVERIRPSSMLSQAARKAASLPRNVLP